MGDPWEGNRETASEVFRFFGVQPTQREHGDAMLFAGQMGDKILMVTCPNNKPRVLAVEYCTLQYVHMEGVILDGCELYRRIEDGGEEDKRFLIQGGHYCVEIASSGLYTAPGRSMRTFAESLTLVRGG